MTLSQLRAEGYIFVRTKNQKPTYAVRFCPYMPAARLVDVGQASGDSRTMAKKRAGEIALAHYVARRLS